MEEREQAAQDRPDIDDLIFRDEAAFVSER
jgi:hypothetical protein